MVFVLVQREQTAETTDIGKHFWAVGRLDQRLDHIDETVAGFDIDAGAFIGHA